MNFPGLISQIFIFCIVLMAPQPSFAQEVKLNLPSQVNMSFDPFSGFSIAETVKVSIVNSGLEPLDTRLIITPQIGNEFVLLRDSETLSFEINSSLGSTGHASFEAPISLPANSSEVALDLNITIYEGQYADPGELQQDLSFMIIDAATLIPLSEEMSMRLAANIPVRAQVNLAGTSAGFSNGVTNARVDFGRLKSFDSRMINLQVRGNSDLDITMTSENAGYLINSQTSNSAKLPYSITMDGIQSDLVKPLILSRRPARSLNGSSFPVTITIGVVDISLPEGRYQDMITIDVNPR